MRGTFFLDLLLEKLEAIKGNPEFSGKLNVSDLSLLEENNFKL
jgi:hypothetical protein